MGRKKIYRTEEERHEAQLEWQREHYKRNKEKILQKARKKYKQKKLEKIKEKRGKKLYGE